ncbi:ribosome-associated translation inhibitor RaiA [Saprospiraceae bacterium]|jgi:putative sigma-54 modulation protein|nr:ribosome-associated translation inhibitor RaiA [Bacteroidota bacterium]MDB4727373.1 ribosome-associated translation inhibitor RaiA [Saprospiraceae bacterium]MDF1863721.1 ribosome-associated translation inhibitor RaiA [Saprospiraceae bacterium]
MKVHTESVQFKADQKLVDYVEKKLAKLDTFFDRIIGADVKLRLENSGQVRDKIAEIRLNVPGTTLFAKETNKTFEASIDLALDNLKRQLTKYKSKMRARASK